MKKLTQWSLVVALSTTLAGASVHTTVNGNSTQNTDRDAIAAIDDTNPASTKQFDLFNYLPPQERLRQLELKAKAPHATLERSRARYVLANIYLGSRNPSGAISLLEGLEGEYPQLAEYILLKRAQALKMTGNPAATTAWEQILSKYPQSPAAAEALFALGQTQQLLEKFPSHPRSRTLVLTALQQSPNRGDLLERATVFSRNDKSVLPILNRAIGLANKGALRLSPDRWWVVADTLFDERDYTKAANAYARATATPFTAYRIGRSLHKAGQKTAAYAAYNRVVQQYPNSPQAPRALIRMMQIAQPPEALQIADSIMARYPDTAAEALQEKASILQNKLNNGQAASSLRNLILNRYPTSEAAAQISWRIAWQSAKAGNLKQALNSVKNITAHNADSEIAAEAAFWGGKWASRAGDRNLARQSFEFVLRQHPESYFAWRSAGQLGWQVGNFETARNVSLPLQPPSTRSPLLAGSPALQELYLLGQDRDASDRWQFEIGDRPLQSYKEIFTDGVMRLGVNDNLRGIHQIESLTWLDVTSAEKAEIAALERQPEFWQALYPFPYWQTVVDRAQQQNICPALVMGLIRQESRFEAQIYSASGAIGLMQVMPDTGAWIASKIGVKSFSLLDPEQNINFGIWYLNYTHNQFGNNSMLAVASYNAGPGAIGRWVSSTGIGDPDDFVERIPYDETRGYVRHVFGNYWNYLRLYSPTLKQQIAQLESPDPSTASVPRTSQIGK